MKKTILIMFAFFLAITGVFGASFFTTYQMNFPNNQPSSVFVNGGQCTTAGCANINSTVELYNANQVNSCWAQDSNNVAAFNSCIASAKISGNIVNLSGTANQVVTKVTTPATFGYVTWFSPSGDSYIPQYDRATNYVCNYSTCFDPNVVNLDFTKKANAIATIGQLNVQNVDNSNLPVQVSVPVSLDQSVCSAYQLAQPGMYVPTIPQGYSDFSANTKITMTATALNGSATYMNQSVVIPIKANTCAGLSAFSWTAPSNLVNQQVKFTATSKVVDNQVSSSTPDSASVIETMFPQTLNGSCWARGYNLTLANSPTLSMTSSNTQISSLTQFGLNENLFATYTAGAFMDSSITPMSFEAILAFNGTIVSQNLYNSGSSLKTYSTNLTSYLANVNPGTYNVQLTLRPVGSSCTNTANVVLDQKVHLVAAQDYNVSFHVSNANGTAIPSALVNMQLLNLNGNYPSTVNYNNSIFANNKGIAKFSNIVAGTYKYVISNGNQRSSSIITVGSTSDIYVTLQNGNSAPAIALPSQINEYYKNPVTIDLKNYVVDANNAFSELNLTAKTLSGNAVTSLNNGVLTVTTNQIGTANVEVGVVDPSGARANATVLINFTNNQPPRLNSFSATPSNGQAPFKTTFNVNASSVDSDLLSCQINFGDGTTAVGVNALNCAGLNGITHTYNNTGSYNATLTISDGSNPAITASRMVYVYNRTGPAPKINSFTLTSSNGHIGPTNLRLAWDVVQTGGWPMNCSLRYNSTNHNVSCIGSTTITGFNQTGTTDFTLIAIDNASTQVMQTIPFNIAKPSNLFDKTSLLMNDVIAPGKFNISIKMVNETFSRNIQVRPVIRCNGTTNKYDSGALTTSIESTPNVNGSKTFGLTLNTNDFQLNVPTNVSCTFVAELSDNLGFKAVKSKEVTFAYPVVKAAMKSVRGTSVDVLNFMSSTLTKSFSTGYHTIQFTLKNNNDTGKKMGIQLTSAGLGINYEVDQNLPSGGQTQVSIPVYISSNVKAGSYPTRISVSDGNNKQIRYTDIIVK